MKHRDSEQLSVAEGIQQERDRQNEKWGPQNHNPMKWLTILMEEVGEAAKEILEHRPLMYRAEMVQVAAVAQAMIESFDRNEGKGL